MAIDIPPNAETAFQTNLIAQRRVRDAIKSYEWKMHQPIVSRDKRVTGSRDATLFKFVGPMMIEVRFRIIMNKDATGGVVTARTGKDEGPTLGYGTYTVGHPPEQGKYDIAPNEALYVQESFHREVSGIRSPKPSTGWVPLWTPWTMPSPGS